MKFRIALLCTMLFMALSTSHARTPLRVVAKDAFLYVKMTKQMLGGNIEVRDSTGQVVSTKNIDHRKMYLDLFELADGKYNVIVKHDDIFVEFSYEVESAAVHAKRKHHSNRHAEILQGTQQTRIV